MTCVNSSDYSKLGLAERTYRKWCGYKYFSAHDNSFSRAVHIKLRRISLQKQNRSMPLWDFLKAICLRAWACKSTNRTMLLSPYLHISVRGHADNQTGDRNFRQHNVWCVFRALFSASVGSNRALLRLVFFLNWTTTLDVGMWQTIQCRWVVPCRWLLL